MSRWKLNRAILPPLVLALCLFGVYLRTLAPGLTWANDGSDGGDLITAAATGGIAHPTGYPLYLLLARLFQFLPLGSLAYRTNLMSALFTALAATLVYRLVERGLPGSKGGLRWLAGLGAGFAFGLAPLVWSQAVISEVYALQAVLVVSVLYLYAKPQQATRTGQKRLDILRGLALGLALSNHVTALLLLPMALALGTFRLQAGTGQPASSENTRFRTFFFDGNALLRQLIGFGLGASLYLSLPLRALAGPPLNWGNPLTPGRLWWLASGALYQSYYLGADPGVMGEQLRAAAALSVQQFGLPGLALGLIGLVVFWRPSRLYLLSAWTAFVFLVFSLCYQSVDWTLYLIPAFTAFAVWIGLGLAGLLAPLYSRSRAFGLLCGLLACAYVVTRSLSFLDLVDASRDLRAEGFGQEVLSTVPEDAILFVNGDRALFTLWYYHFALEQRPDLAVIAEDLLHFDWYLETLRATYPGLGLPGPLPWPGTVSAANPSRPACYVSYVRQAEIECIQALTTP